MSCNIKRFEGNWTARSWHVKNKSRYPKIRPTANANTVSAWCTNAEQCSVTSNMGLAPCPNVSLFVTIVHMYIFIVNTTIDGHMFKICDCATARARHWCKKKSTNLAWPDLTGPTNERVSQSDCNWLCFTCFFFFRAIVFGVVPDKTCEEDLNRNFPFLKSYSATVRGTGVPKRCALKRMWEHSFYISKIDS